MDVNEQIAKAYFEEVHSYVVKTNHYFKKHGKKGGVGPADIDLVLIHPKGKGIYGPRCICSVKGWQSSKISLSQIKDINKIFGKWKIFGKDELNAAEMFFGNEKFNKLLILPPIKHNEKKDVKDYCKNNYKIVLLDFTDILIELIEHLSLRPNINRSYDIQVLQTLRIVLINILQIKNEKIAIQAGVLNHLKLKKDNYNIKFHNNPTNKELLISKNI